MYLASNKMGCKNALRFYISFQRREFRRVCSAARKWISLVYYYPSSITITFPWRWAGSAIFHVHDWYWRNMTAARISTVVGPSYTTLTGKTYVFNAMHRAAQSIDSERGSPLAPHLDQMGCPPRR